MGKAVRATGAGQVDGDISGSGLSRPSVLCLHAQPGRSGRASGALAARAPGQLRGGQVAFSLPKRAAIPGLAEARRGPGWGPDPRANLALGLSYRI